MTNSESSKVYQTAQVTDALKAKYDALTLTESETRVILANTKTRVFFKGDFPPASQV